ncbi:aminoglycoside phosphotransferase family protein [Devosia sp.]|uniref:phosphotransferase family protein n=1 Tax=Devosia sp. TaxID=1871048 RepID=UPI003262FA0B
MPMPPSPALSLETLRAAIVARFPELADAHFSLLTEGWDSIGVDIDDQWICKFPRQERAEAALRREVALLGIIRPAVSMPLPDMTLYESPMTFTRHRKLAGEHLLTADYERLDDSQRQQLAEAMGRFYGQLHRLDPTPLRAAGARDIYDWTDPSGILHRALPHLTDGLDRAAQLLVTAYLALPPDPLGTTFGYFDGHGWNMAFDHVAGRLNGLYDFGDSGFGSVHREFVYGSFVSLDLTARTIAAYEAASGRQIDRARINLLTGMLRLWELAGEAGTENAPVMLKGFQRWAAAQ